MTRRKASQAQAHGPAPLPKRQAGPHEPCDCLIFCGDDPWLAEGKARPCAAKVKRDHEAAEACERMRLQQDLAASAALSCIRSCAPSEWHGQFQWFRVDEPARLNQPHADVARAARYLLLSERAINHPTRPGLLRLVETNRRCTDAGSTAGDRTQ